MNRRLTILATLFGLLLIATLATGSALGSGSADVAYQTWPSRTPTPSGPGQPPNPPGTQSPPEAPAGATSQPGSVPAATSAPATGGQGSGAGQVAQPPSSGATQPGQGLGEGITLETLQLPSAAEVGSCGLPPLAVALGRIDVRSGPGNDFDIVAELAFQEERPVVGRAASAPWWQVLIAVGQLGWVSDQAVAIVGFTGAVPVLEIDQETGLTWSPTPNPACTPPSQQEIAFSDGQLATVILAENLAAAEEAGQEPAPAAEGESAVANTPGFSRLRPDEDATGVSLLWLPIVGGFLIVAGGIALLLQRRRA